MSCYSICFIHLDLRVQMSFIFRLEISSAVFPLNCDLINPLKKKWKFWRVNPLFITKTKQKEAVYICTYQNLKPWDLYIYVRVSSFESVVKITVWWGFAVWCILWPVKTVTSNDISWNYSATFNQLSSYIMDIRFFERRVVCIIYAVLYSQQICNYWQC